MAVAGVHNVSVINSSLAIESQSPLSKLCANHDKPSTQASSLLQMWRELEEENTTNYPQPMVGEISIQGSAAELNANLSSASCLINSNEDEKENIRSPRGQQNERDDCTSSSSESIDFSEVERERVREVFREWQNNGLRNKLPDDLNPKNSSKAEWLGEKERERVRLVREWVEKTTQQSSTYHVGREGQDNETATQINPVREGFIVNHCEGTPRRTVLKLCGRQALLDLLMRAENERKRELQDLLTYRHVSDFPYRNRIQSLLKGRFLRNKAYNLDEKPSSIAASELGILRQKYTVSCLREEFLSSKLEKVVCGPVGSVQSNTSSHCDIHCHRNEQTQVNSLQPIVLNNFCCPQEPTSEETDTIISYTEDSDSDVSEGLQPQESTSLEGESQVVLESEDREQLSSAIEFNERHNYNRESAPGNSLRRSADGRWHETSGSRVQDTLVEAHLSGSQGYDSHTPERDAASGDRNQLKGTIFEGTSWQSLPLELADWQDSLTVDGDNDWGQLSNADNGWREDNDDGIMSNSNASNHQHYQFDNDNSEHYHLQVLHEEWNALSDTRDLWSDEPFVEEVTTFDTSHFSDDDNGQSLELRQLQSRRRVSNLLRSDFRASLDQLLQSYVERRDQASVDWELEIASSSPGAVIEEEQGQQIGDLPMDEPEAVGRTTLPAVILPSPYFTSSETTWDQDMGYSNQQQANSHQSGIDMEIINDLRVDMAILHQRMNSMQMMLEACMDMQLELQRSVRQEVSAALNWQSRSADCEDNLVPDESKLEQVKKGICCICCDTKIDALLYRCGHMCTCSKCSQKLVQSKDKCPMCRAPVIEVIRAYSIQ